MHVDMHVDIQFKNCVALPLDDIVHQMVPKSIHVLHIDNT